MEKLQILVYFAIYYLGRFKFSVLWIVLFAMLTIYGYERSARTRVRNEPESNERDVVFASLIHDIPSWVLFPDVERVEWINTVLKTLWPRLRDYSERKLRELQPKINRQPWLRNLKIDKVTLGDITPRITGIKVHDRNVLREEIVVDFHVSYSGDFLLTLSMFGFEGGIRNIQLDGSTRVVMKSFVSKPPFITSFEFSFLACPKFDYELLTVFATLNVKVVKKYIHSTVKQLILNHLVFPHKFVFKVKAHESQEPVPDLSEAEMLPDIEGIIHAEIKKITKFVGFDNQRACVTLELGSQSVASKKIVIDHGTAAMNFECDLIQFVGGKKKIKIDLGIKDENDELTQLRGVVDLKPLSKDKPHFEKYRLSPSGRVPMTLTWLELSSNRTDLTDDGRKHSALLELFVDSARKLSKDQPGVFVELSIANTTQQTWASEDANPSWRKYFSFFFHNPQDEALTIKLIHQATSESCGQFVYKISDLIARRQMKHELQAFPLNLTAHSCEILMSLKLSALKTLKAH